MYGLSQEHFAVNPKTEYKVFFAREEEFHRFHNDLIGTMDSGRVPRYVVYGLFGVGKTHFLLHLSYEIRDKAEPVYIETPSIHRRTSFLEFHRAIVSALGRRTTIDLLTQGLKKPSKALELGLSEDTIYVLSNALKEKQHFLLWKFLTGEKLKAAEADRIEAVRPQLSIEEAVDILNALAILHERTNRKPLLLLVDEFETTRHLGGDAKTAFTEAMRSLVDEASRVAVVFALTARSLAEIPSVIEDEPVRRRIGITNFIEFRPYEEDLLRKFMKQVIEYRRAPKFNIKNALASLQANETVDAESYPFSQEALKEIVSSVVLFYEQNRIEAVRPKEALDMMDKSLRLAISRKLPFIGKDTIISVREETVEALKL